LVTCRDSRSEAQEVENLENRENSEAAMGRLVKFITLHTDSWFEEFIKALKIAKYDEFVALLEPKLGPAGKLLC
jgi:hypothetical protein